MYLRIDDTVDNPSGALEGVVDENEKGMSIDDVSFVGGVGAEHFPGEAFVVEHAEQALQHVGVDLRAALRAAEDPGHDASRGARKKLRE